MEIDFLRHYGFSKSILKLLETAHGKTFLPIQERAIQSGGLFENRNLLISAPTSCGKTFIAELVFLWQTKRNRKTMLLVPTKALAHQRYEEWKNRYESEGYRIVLSSRDHRKDDRRIQDGDFHLAIIIYEKLLSFLSLSDRFVSCIGTCIVDELQYLDHSERGPNLDLLITTLKRNSNIQFIGLSAFPIDRSVSDWMDAPIIEEAKRPVELQQGVLFQNRFYYLEHNSRKTGVEEIAIDATDDEGQLMIDAAVAFYRNNESTLLFFPNRALCYTAARKIASTLSSTQPTDLSALQRLEPTTMKRFLEKTVASHVAIHTSDLSFEERNAVESMIRSGAVRIVCATNTLAEGINLPVDNVLTSKLTYRTSRQDTLGQRSIQQEPLTEAQLHNMIGRAGRYGYRPVGRGMVVTAYQSEVEGWKQTLDQSERYTIGSTQPKPAAPEWFLRSIGLSNADRIESFQSFLSQTFCISKMHSLSDILDSTITYLMQQGFMTEHLSRYCLTHKANVVLRQGVSLSSVHAISQFVEEYHYPPNPIDTILFLCQLREMEAFYFSISRAEIHKHVWTKEIRRRYEEACLVSSPYLLRMFQHPELLGRSQHLACKKTVLLLQWIELEPLETIEQSFAIHLGNLNKLCEDIAWLISCMYEIACAYEQEWNSLPVLAERIVYGLPEEHLTIKDRIQSRSITRSQYIQQIQKEDRNQESDTSGDTSSKPFRVRKHPNRPDRWHVNGNDIALTPIQSSIVDMLMQAPQQCVAYSDLVHTIWGGYADDRKQLNRQKNAILRKVQRTCGKSEHHLIEVVPGQGLILQASIE